jgi:transposase
MNDKRLYEQLLGISHPWSVADVTLRLDQGEVLITIEGDPESEVCPDCGKRCPGYDRQERRWRHLDTFQYRTILIASVPRISCSEHGVRRVRVPWAEERSRFTALFEALVIDWLRSTEHIAAVARGMGLTWDEVAGIRSRAVARGLERRGRAELPAAIGVDETSFRKGHEYITVVNALSEARVLEVIDERTEASLTSFWSRYTPEEREKVEFVAMDMWAAYITSTTKHLTEAHRKIVFDPFHVMKHLGDAVDRVRREENRALKKEGDKRLQKTRYLWLTHAERWTREARDRMRSLKQSTLRTVRAFRYKEEASKLWRYTRRGMADRMWRSWLRGALRCSLDPIRKAARMILTHLDGILNAATSDITNAMSESVNSHIQRIKRRACGFRSRQRFREAILFHLGGLDLYPTLSPSTHSKS